MFAPVCVLCMLLWAAEVMPDVHVPQRGRVRSHLGLVRVSPVPLETLRSSLITCGSLWPALKTLSWHGRLTIIDAETFVNSAYKRVHSLQRAKQLDNCFNFIYELNLIKSGFFGITTNYNHACEVWFLYLKKPNKNKKRCWACIFLMLHVIQDLVQGLWKLEIPLWLSESPAVEIINTEQEFTLGNQWKSALRWWLCLNDGVIKSLLYTRHISSRYLHFFTPTL